VPIGLQALISMEPPLPQPWNKYDLTAARRHGRPGCAARPSSVTVDAHSHVAVPAADALVMRHVGASGSALARFATPETRELGQRQTRERLPRMVERDLRLGDLDAMGVDVQAIMPPPNPAYYAAPVDVAAAACRLANEGMVAFRDKAPDRFVALGIVPLQDGAAAATELERATSLGLKGVEILTNVNGKELSDEAFAPFWAAAERLGALVVIHPAGFTEAERLTRFYFNNLIGNPFDTTLALHYLIFDGVLERHPGLKILAVHGGGFAAAYAGRMDHGWGARSDAHGSLPQPPTSYLKRIYFDTVVFTTHQLEALVAIFGADRIIMGTDYPYDMAEYDPLGHVMACDGLDADEKAAIAGGNAKQLLGL